MQSRRIALVQSQRLAKRAAPARAVRCSTVAHAKASHATRLCTAIQRHLESHPAAADTIDGIVNCWLPSLGFEDAADHIEEAIEKLVAARWLRPVSLPDGNVLYAATRTEERCSILPLTS